MKFLISFLLIAVSLNLSSQTIKEIKIAKTKVPELKSLSDIITDIPKDCKVIGFICSVNLNGSLKEFSCMGDGMSAELKSVISSKEKGQWFFIENIKSGCEKSHKPSYKIILE